MEVEQQHSGINTTMYAAVNHRSVVRRLNIVYRANPFKLSR